MLVTKRHQSRSFLIYCSRSVAGLGVSGPLGPRSGISSGILPGSSSGRGGSPGSRIGGGASGFGLPGGIPGGGSVGVPGVAGGISGGSIGIYIVTLQFSPLGAALPIGVDLGGVDEKTRRHRQTYAGTRRSFLPR